MLKHTSLAFAYDTETTLICTLNKQEENVIAYTNLRTCIIVQMWEGVFF